MKEKDWQLTTPIDAVVFDCDGTLSHIEGIDELAALHGVREQVSALTERAMSETGITNEIYRERLNLVRPTREQVIALGQDYFLQRSPSVSSVIDILQRLDKAIYIISAGFNLAVKRFGELLGVSEQNIFAVDLIFDEQGEYLDYDHNAYTTSKNGKRRVVSLIKQKYQRLLYVGDGMNDLEARDLVERFVGYGGSYYREGIANLCPFYMTAASMAPLLPLALTASEVESLTGEEQALYLVGEAHLKKCSMGRS